ncbi:MAG TPA: N-acetylmuramoyl-L-alanine amidase [Candidatus Acidoferrales bacterium]|nr:N-acetylmuramoyl-L-alanine amidase [Candidatus Acidoferrales bacterium]
MRGRLNLGAPILAGLLAAISAAAVPVAAQSPAASKRAEAKADLARADKLRADLEGRPQKDRTKQAYSNAITAYRRVVHAAPASSEAQTALVAIADLYHEMGRAFDDSYFEKAIDTYQALLKEYPATRYRSDAMFTIGQIQHEDLDHPDDAEKSFDDFLAKYPRSQKAAAAQEELKSIAAERAAAHATGSASAKSAADDLVHDRRTPQVTAIREWNAENYTRVVISLEDEVKYQAARIANPDRIYFDLYTAHLSSALAGKTLEVQNGFLKSVRVAQNQAGVVRVVLEVEKVKDYSVFLLKDPYRLVVDVYGDTTTAKAAPPPTSPGAPADKSAQTTPSAKNSGATAPSGKNSAPGSLQASNTSQKPSATGKSASAKSSPRADKTGDANAQADSSEKAQKADAPSSAKTEVADNQEPAEEETPAPKDAQPAPAKPSGPAAEPQGSISQPTHRGERSLTRTLGLKIGKIVIDPGHGGHDTGTVGPTGLNEKDLTLDVALRLGKLIEQKLGAQVVFTRTDDTFVPLEERTALANQAKADLFISIHANSSDDPSARGIETFYLNLTDSEEARKVAARENALSQASIHDLQDLVEKIARNEKIDESRELATEVQAGLAKRMQRASRAQKNRGVKRAPFVVLLGANMPSILTEVAFISNPADEAAMKKGDQRQKVAEGLLAGITQYLESLGSAPHTAALLNSPRPVNTDR